MLDIRYMLLKQWCMEHICEATLHSVHATQAALFLCPKYSKLNHTFYQICSSHDYVTF